MHGINNCVHVFVALSFRLFFAGNGAQLAR